MKTIDQVAFLVQARLSSQRCPKKMIRDFAGTTLLDINIKKLVDSEFIPNENIYVSIHEPELKEIVRKYPVNIFDRSEKSANSEGTPMTEIYEWWDKLPHEYVVLTNACAPMLKIRTIEEFSKSYLRSESDGLFGVMAKKNYFWDDTGKFLTPLEGAVMNTKSAKPIYEAAHVLYASRMSDIGRGIWMGDFRIPGQIELFEVDEQECFDIDYEWEFEIYEKLYRK
ncbi:MAG: hypothetical protein CMC82_00330 [Flavobacteriaceae bacterium]|nr:hypothetical protein [Flavobacteriaceae bacterium]|tara:strand:+ start:1110 stop:1784 length:675 start_codon:yes stop_codon:yes gene_type:complete